MIEKEVLKIQIGKNGLTENLLGTLDTYFKKHKNVKVAVLKSAREEKTMTKEYAQQILDHLGTKYTAKVIGHTICLKKWRHDRE